MKKLRIVFMFMGLGLLFSCEDVIDVDLQEAQERLVVEASMLKFKDESGENQQIRLTKTRGFFEDSVTTVQNAQVSVTRIDDDKIFEFVHDSAGIYRTSAFEVDLLKRYKLEIEVDGEIFTAEEVFAPVSKIDSVSQRNDAGFSGDVTELKAFYTDPAGTANYYLFTFFVNFASFPDVNIFEDEFFDGNTIFALYQEEELQAGDEVIIQNFGMSEQFYNYMFILLNQVGASGGPFQAQPATVRGNIINQTNPDNFPFGYFNLSETDQLIYTVKE